MPKAWLEKVPPGRSPSAVRLAPPVVRSTPAAAGDAAAARQNTAAAPVRRIAMDQVSRMLPSSDSAKLRAGGPPARAMNDELATLEKGKHPSPHIPPGKLRTVFRACQSLFVRAKRRGRNIAAARAR